MRNKAAAMYHMQKGAIITVDAHIQKHNQSIPPDFLQEQADGLYNALLFLPDDKRRQVCGLAEGLITYFCRKLSARQPIIGLNAELAGDFVAGMQAYDVAALSITKPKIARLATLYEIDTKKLETIMSEAKTRS